MQIGGSLSPWCTAYPPHSGAVITRVFLITLLEDVDNVPRASLSWHQLRGLQGLHEPSKHVQAYGSHGKS